MDEQNADADVGIVEVSAPGLETRQARAGDRLVFGRAPEADLPLGDDLWLSRQAGEIMVTPDGVRIANLSKKHALYVKLTSDTLRLPPISSDSGDVGCFLVSGTADVGSSAMIDQNRAVRLLLPAQWQTVAPTEALDLASEGKQPEGTLPTTQLPLKLQPYTKEFMVAFLLCRPWLEDQTRTAPLPSMPQIVEAALQVTEAHHLLRNLPADQELRNRLSQQVHEHLKGLRNKLKQRDLVRPDVAVSPSVIASTLLYHDIIGTRHLSLLNNTDWLTAQENRWWGG